MENRGHEFDDDSDLLKPFCATILCPSATWHSPNHEAPVERQEYIDDFGWNRVKLIVVLSSMVLLGVFAAIFEILRRYFKRRLDTSSSAFDNETGTERRFFRTPTERSPPDYDQLFPSEGTNCESGGGCHDDGEEMPPTYDEAWLSLSIRPGDQVSFTQETLE